MGDPTATLDSLAALLREADTVISPYVSDSDAAPALGKLAASGPRASQAPDEYALMFEAIREGYLLHYGVPRLLEAGDSDLRLLAGDYLYALGLERLAACGDLAAVRELADLISLSAQLHSDQEGASGDGAVAAALWLGSAVAVGAGASEAHQSAKQALRQGGTDSPELLAAAARESAEVAGMGAALAAAADSIGFAALNLPDRG
jgi:hypothetical protein